MHLFLVGRELRLRVLAMSCMQQFNYVNIVFFNRVHYVWKPNCVFSLLLLEIYCVPMR